MSCTCISETNASLAGHNAELVTVMFGEHDGKPLLQVARLAPRGKRPPAVLAHFCPFCGSKLGPAKEAA